MEKNNEIETSVQEQELAVATATTTEETIPGFSIDIENGQYVKFRYVDTAGSVIDTEGTIGISCNGYLEMRVDYEGYMQAQGLNPETAAGCEFKLTAKTRPIFPAVNIYSIETGDLLLTITDNQMSGEFYIPLNVLYKQYGTTDIKLAFVSETLEYQPMAIPLCGFSLVYDLQVTVTGNTLNCHLGKDVDASGLVVERVYDTNCKEQITDFSYLPQAITSLDETELTVSDGKKTASVAINVIDYVLTVMAADSQIYTVGSAIDVSNVTVSREYADGLIDVVENYTYTPSYIQEYGTKEITISDGLKTVQMPVYIASNDTSKLGQTELKYDCSAGTASVNLITQKMVFEHLDLMMGIESYQIMVSHIYNTMFNEYSLLNENVAKGYLRTYMGKGFKLSVQQYIFMSGSGYTYVDGAGYRHTFMLRPGNCYYDTTGLGYHLTVDETAQLPYLITDDLGNKLYFDVNGRMVKTVACHDDSMIKFFNHNELGQLVEIYDGRNASSKILLEYDSENQLLKKMKLMDNESEQDSCEYTYDSNGYLIKIQGKQGNVVFSYDVVNDLLIRLGSEPDGAMMTMEYNDRKITGIAKGAGGTVAENGSVSFGRFLPSIRDYQSRTYFTKEPFKNRVLVTNQRAETANEENDLTVAYYYNQKGYVTSMFEVTHTEDGSEDLKTLKRIPGITIPLGYASVGGSLLNAQTVYSSLRSNEYHLSMGREPTDAAQITLQNYRKLKYSAYKYYEVSFWLNISEALSDPRVTVRIDSRTGNMDSHSFTKKVYIDNSAIYAWQRVVVPVLIEDQIITDIYIQVGDENDSETLYQMSDARLVYAANKGCYLKLPNEAGWTSIDNVEELTYTLEDGRTKTVSIGADFYLSGKDLQSTYLSMYKNRGLTNSGMFELSVCDGKKKLWVQNVVTTVKNEQNGENATFSFVFDEETDSDGKTYGLAMFNNETISPDGLTSIYTYYRYYTDGKIMAYMPIDRQTGNDTLRTVTNACSDLHGKLLSETDEYGVVTTYSYDISGQLTHKILTARNTAGIYERIEYSAKQLPHFKWKKSPVDYALVRYNPATGLPTQSSYSGNPSDGNNVKIFYTYNAKNRLSEVYAECIYSDEADNEITETFGKQKLEYDACGRLFKAMAVNPDGTNCYGYKTKYNTFGDPSKHYLITADGAEYLMVEKQMNYEAGTARIIRHAAEDFETLMITDKYGRTTMVSETVGEDINPKITTFNRQDLWESAGAAEITESYDPYTNRRKVYTYDEFNNLTGYGFTKENDTASNLFIRRTDVDDLEIYLPYNYAVNISTTYDENASMSPRISKIHQRHTGGVSSTIITQNYSYDHFGRIRYAGKNLNEETAMIEYTTYKNGTNLKETVEVETLGNSIAPYIITNTFNYVYDNYGRISQSTHVRDYGVEETETKSYSYNAAGWLVSETSGNETKKYFYRTDGSISKIETVVSDVVEETKEYVYNNQGRLWGIARKDGDTVLGTSAFVHDNLGNCIRHGNNILAWERGGLLKTFGAVSYQNDGNGMRVKKTKDGVDTHYVYDGTKLLETNDIYFIYGIDGIDGFKYKGVKYLYLKDVQGNVVSILYGKAEVARYSYDAWGNCTVEKNVDGIAQVNPIRWKSHYFDADIGCYYIRGKWYSPEACQYLSPASPEEIMALVDTPCGLNSYALTLDNPVELMYNDDTYESSEALSYDPVAMTEWEWWKNVKVSWFWGTDFGKWVKPIVAIALFIAATVMTICLKCPAAWAIYAETMVTSTVYFIAAAAIAGLQNLASGDDFWEGALTYVSDNWASALAIASISCMVSIGIQGASGSLCFIAGTLILCQGANGEKRHKPIEEIEEGDLVWAYDEETGKSAWKPVVRLFRNESKEWVVVTVNGVEIESTPGHKYYLPHTKHWVSAKDLKPGNKVLLSDGSEATVEGVVEKHYDNAQTTYNFEVADFHTYYVSKQNVLVHNKGCKFNHKKDADYYVKYKENGRTYTAYHQAKGNYKGLFIAKDNYGHGGSAFKLLKEVSGSKLQLINDLDIYGDIMYLKHSSNLGKIYHYYGGANL